MTEKIFLADQYLRNATSVVSGVGQAGGIVVDRSVFYPAGGGQPGDIGRIHWDSGSAAVADTRKCGASDIELVLAEGSDSPPAGATVNQELDWGRRFSHMRIHTALHLLSVVIPLPVTGGSISATKGRLDFDMPEPLENKEELQERLIELVARDLQVTERWITDEELIGNPQLVKTMAVKPPIGFGRVRLVRIGTDDSEVDLQPCGGTHVASTGEIGALAIGKVEKKGRTNRRVNIGFAT